MIAIDTNLLVYAHRQRVPEHRRAQAAIEGAATNPRGWGFAAGVLPEFWAVVTHPSAEGRPSTPAQAAAFIRALTSAGAAMPNHDLPKQAKDWFGTSERCRLATSHDRKRCVSYPNIAATDRGVNAHDVSRAGMIGDLNSKAWPTGGHIDDQRRW